ncbi:hypothetical protein TCON_0206 [Astathelohania contejeani]|uniref:FPL domain-containing protein n=1 Tax=Astathelohania contejeani TaxID=164912 RepID=A0ABQ7I2I3_9MICR|nr:hypothetical protein TCON_0206 [Thelohania contejeani]
MNKIYFLINCIIYVIKGGIVDYNSTEPVSQAIESYINEKGCKFEKIINKHFDIKVSCFTKRCKIENKMLFNDTDQKYVIDCLEYLIKEMHQKNTILITNFLGKYLFILTFYKGETFLSFYGEFLSKFRNKSFKLHHNFEEELLPLEYLNVFTYKMKKKFENLYKTNDMPMINTQENIKLKVFIIWTMLYFTLTNYTYLETILSIKASVITNYLSLLILQNYHKNDEILFIAILISSSHSTKDALSKTITKIFNPNSLLFHLTQELTDLKFHGSVIFNFMFGIIDSYLVQNEAVSSANIIIYYYLNIDIRCLLIKYFNKENEDEFLDYFIDHLFYVDNVSQYDQIYLFLQNPLFLKELNPLLLKILNRYFMNWYNSFNILIDDVSTMISIDKECIWFLTPTKLPDKFNELQTVLSYLSKLLFEKWEFEIINSESDKDVIKCKYQIGNNGIYLCNDSEFNENMKKLEIEKDGNKDNISYYIDIETVYKEILKYNIINMEEEINNAIKIASIHQGNTGSIYYQITECICDFVARFNLRYNKETVEPMDNDNDSLSEIDTRSNDSSEKSYKTALAETSKENSVENNFCNVQ